MGVQPDTTPGGVEARSLKNLITESIAKGVELGIAKALSAIESRPASDNPVTADGLSSSTVPAQPRFSIGSAAQRGSAAAASSNDVGVQSSATTSSNTSKEFHSITASSLQPQIPGRPGLELSTLLQDKDQEMELQISSHSAKPTFTLVPKNKKEVNTIAKWIKAFNCFTAVYTRRWPQEVPGLLKHMQVVISLADDNANWRLYDRSFRKLHANGLESLGQINVDFYLSASKGPFRSGNSRWGDEKDSKSGKGDVRGRLASHLTGYCFAFHNGKGCSGCSYKHRCYKCDEDHRMSDCKKPRANHGGKGANRKGAQHPRKT